jgi:FkbM family methyltransferase
MPLIYDIGFHTGQDTAYYLARGSRVIAVEANPLLVEKGQARFRDAIDGGRLELLSLGIGSKEGIATFFVNRPHDEYSSFNRDIASRDAQEVTEVRVPVLTLADVIARHGPAHYVKIDIEGYDHVAINSLKGTEIRPNFISVENGFERDLNSFLELGYKRFAFVNQATIPQARIPADSQEGAQVPWDFPRGASGLFGSDLGDQWLGYDEILPRIRAYWQKPDRNPSRDGWFDLHAAFDPAT